MAAWASTATGHQPGRGGRPTGAPARTASSSSASGSPCDPRTAASRTACAQGVGSPAAAWSATVRTACSTRCRAVASSSAWVAHGEPPGRWFAPVLVPAPQPQPGRAARAVGVAPPRALGRLARRRGADRVREPVGELVARLLAEPGLPPVRVDGPQTGRRGVHVGGDPARRGSPLGHELAERLAQFPDAVPGERGQREHGRARFAVLAERDPVLVEQPPQVVEDLVGGLPGQPVDLVEDDEGDLRVSRHGPQIALVQHGVGVLLRVDDPDDGVDERQDAVHLFAVLDGRGVVVGQVDQDEPAQLRLGLRALQRAPSQPPRDAEPVDEARRAVAPTARDGRGGGRPAYPGLRNGHSGERVEELRLAAAGGARDGDDGVLSGEPAPRGGLVEDLARLGERPAVEPGAGEPDQFTQRVEAGPQRTVVRERGHHGRPAVHDCLLHGPGLSLRRGGHAPRDQPVVPGDAGVRGVGARSRRPRGPCCRCRRCRRCRPCRPRKRASRGSRRSPRARARTCGSPNGHLPCRRPSCRRCLLPKSFLSNVLRPLGGPSCRGPSWGRLCRRSRNRPPRARAHCPHALRRLRGDRRDPCGP